MSYFIEGLDPARFAHLFALDDVALKARGIIPTRADSHGFPCRVALENAPLDDRVLLLNFSHHAVDTPFRSSHAIYVAESSREQRRYQNSIPPALAQRLLSLRAFDRTGMMLDAVVVEGSECEAAIEELLAIERAEYLHIHYAKQGCFAAVARQQ
jgi:Protein of unknown function (DUF1203)